MASLAPISELEHVRAAVRSLDDPPSAPGWNHDELCDLIGTVPLSAAAVLVPLVERPDGLTVLLTRRNEHLSNHAGQVSFPGGRVERSDRDAIAAALRETQEEIGIPAALVLPFGYLDCFDTVSGFCVTPVVASVDSNYVATPDAREVAAVFEVPLAFFLDRSNLHMRKIEYRGRPRDIYEFHYSGQHIWGATAAMLMNLLGKMENAA
jgi:8-oxo-dGTP pyrophosphatase MutT (NUDIX family)